jgi:hypothetical protein
MVDERRSDVPTSEARTPGEAITVRFTVREKQSDGSYLDASAFTGYADWEFYLLATLDAAGPTAAQLLAADILGGNATITPGTAPLVDVAIAEADSANVPIGLRAYELWATVDGSRTRLAFGTIPFVA